MREPLQLNSAEPRSPDNSDKHLIVCVCVYQAQTSSLFWDLGPSPLATLKAALNILFLLKISLEIKYVP